MVLKEIGFEKSSEMKGFVKKQKRRNYEKKVAVILFIIVLVMGGSLFFVHKKRVALQQEARQAEKVRKEQEEKARLEQEAKEKKEQEEKIANVNSQLIGKEYSVIPVLYDGVSLDQSDAPGNVFHDGARGLLFKEGFKVTIELNGAYRPDIEGTYTLTDGHLVISNDQGVLEDIVYNYSEGVLTFPRWEKEWDEGHLVTWEMKLAPSYSN